jgi:hypothetical protein
MKNVKRVVAVTLALSSITVLGGVASGAPASAASCPQRATTKAFSQWGDNNSYFVVPNGSFESGTAGWSLYASDFGSIKTTRTQEPWKVNGSNHANSLRLPAYSTAQVPNICLSSNEEWGRFFYRDPGVAGSSLLVKVEAWSSAGRMNTEIRIPSGRSGWQVSPQIAMPNKRDGNGDQWVTITITPVDAPATWSIDDVMIDPWISR